MPDSVSMLALERAHKEATKWAQAMREHDTHVLHESKAHSKVEDKTQQKKSDLIEWCLAEIDFLEVSGCRKMVCGRLRLCAQNCDPDLVQGMAQDFEKARLRIAYVLFPKSTVQVMKRA